MMTLKISGDNGFDAEVVVFLWFFLVFVWVSRITLSDFDEGVSMADLYRLAHLVMKIQHPQDTPAKLEEFEETFDVLPVQEEEAAGPTPAAP